MTEQPTKKKKKSKKVTQPKKTPMREQDPIVRGKNFDEVPYGYTDQEAIQEAKRCLQCKKHPCTKGCPVEIDIPKFIELIAEGKFVESAQKLKEKNALPAVCGRVCPQETQCEQVCILDKRYESVAIGRLERFAADYERENDLIEFPKTKAKNGRKIAVIGCGPAGITVAGDMILEGYDVTLFEAFHKPGGVLMYGIPEFRLPKAIVEKEVDYLVQLGVKLELNQVVGASVMIDELLNEKGFDGVFIGVGAGLPMFLGVPGEDLGGVYSANEYLTRSNLMKAYNFPEYDTPVYRGKNVTVIGGGNVAMDAARTALRLGADNVYIVYRRSRTELPAREEEIHHAEEEGVIFKLLNNPIAFESDDEGRMIKKMKCIKMELGEPDASGRRRPVTIENSEFHLETDLCVIATGSNANPLLTKATPDIELNKWGNIVAEENIGARTSKRAVWAGGDIVTGSATVIAAMGAGRIAAKDMLEYFDNTTQKWEKDPPPPPEDPKKKK